MRDVELTTILSFPAQNILLYQRLTKVLAKLTHGVEIEVQKHMENLELRLQKAGTAVQGFEPELDRLREILTRVEKYVSIDIEHALKRSGDSIDANLHDATNLQQLLAVAIQTVLDGTSQVAAAQEKTVQLSNQNNEDMDHWSVMMAATAATAMSLNKQIVRVSTSAILSRLANCFAIPGDIPPRLTGAIYASTDHSGRLRSPHFHSGRPVVEVQRPCACP